MVTSATAPHRLGWQRTALDARREADAGVRLINAGSLREADVRATAERRSPADHGGVDIDFTGFAGDCIIGGRYRLGSKRLTDELNVASTITLHDVVLDGLDGQRVTTPTFTIERSELCAVVGRGPRGRRSLRIATDRRRLQAQIGPYVVLGRYHGPLGATSLRDFAERDPLVPLTDATIAYVVGGILEVVDASTLIVNRELASWYREAEDAAEPGLLSIARRSVRDHIGA